MGYKDLSININVHEPREIINIGPDEEFVTINQLAQEIAKNLEFDLSSQNKNFYNFLFDNGIGEKNSLGFGFLNCGK